MALQVLQRRPFPTPRSIMNFARFPRNEALHAPFGIPHVRLALWCGDAWSCYLSIVRRVHPLLPLGSWRRNSRHRDGFLDGPKHGVFVVPFRASISAIFRRVRARLAALIVASDRRSKAVEGGITVEHERKDTTEVRRNEERRTNPSSEAEGKKDRKKRAWSRAARRSDGDQERGKTQTRDTVGTCRSER